MERVPRPWHCSWRFAVPMPVSWMWHWVPWAGDRVGIRHSWAAAQGLLGSAQSQLRAQGGKLHPEGTPGDIPELGDNFMSPSKSRTRHLRAFTFLSTAVHPPLQAQHTARSPARISAPKLGRLELEFDQSALALLLSTQICQSWGFGRDVLILSPFSLPVQGAACRGRGLSVEHTV